MELIGWIAASLTTISFLPQAIKTIKTKDVSGISLGMYAIFSTGVFFWMVYGILLGNLIIIIANVITLTLAGVILRVKIIDVVNKMKKIEGDAKHSDSSLI